MDFPVDTRATSSDSPNLWIIHEITWALGYPSAPEGCWRPHGTVPMVKNSNHQSFCSPARSPSPGWLGAHLRLDQCPPSEACSCGKKLVTPCSVPCANWARKALRCRWLCVAAGAARRGHDERRTCATCAEGSSRAAALQGEGSTRDGFV